MPLKCKTLLSSQVNPTGNNPQSCEDPKETTADVAQKDGGQDGTSERVVIEVREDNG